MKQCTLIVSELSAKRQRIENISFIRNVIIDICVLSLAPFKELTTPKSMVILISIIISALLRKRIEFQNGFSVCRLFFLVPNYYVHAKYQKALKNTIIEKIKCYYEKH